MIITQTPLRISFFGGGTDYPDYFEKFGEGAVLGTAIDKYIYFLVSKFYGKLFDHSIRISYSQKEFVNTIEEIKHVPFRECLRKFNVAKDIEILNSNDFLVIVITNQSPINRGIFTKEKLSEIHDHMKSELQKDGAFIDAIYYCPHTPDEKCLCRKPKIGLITKALEDFSISLKQSFMIGDSITDVKAAEDAGLRAIQMETNGSLLEITKKLVL